jgi:ribosome-associated protein
MDEVLPITDYFVIATGRTKRHVDALLEIVEKRMKELGFYPSNRSGKDAGNWILLDYGWIVVHIFRTDEREYYDLEMLWADAQRIELEDILP